MIDTALTTVAPLQHALALASEAGDLKGLKEVHAIAAALRKGAQARGMGIDAENQASEVVLRSERAIGRILLDVPRVPQSERPAHSTGVQTPFNEALAAAGLLRKSVRSNGTLNLTSGGTAHSWMMLASMPDEQFESMLAELHTLNQRIAKVNFYAAMRKPKDVAEYERSVAAEAPTSAAFEQFRSGVYGLIGWTVDESGEGRGGPEVLVTLPSDNLMEIATLIKALVAAYQQARAEMTQ